MEKSVKNYPVRNRLLLPAALIAAGLLCVSLLSRSQENMSPADSVKAKPDTLTDSIKKNVRTATYSKKRIITIDENGQPHEEIIEEFEGDESLRPLLKGDKLNTLPPPDPGVTDSLPFHRSQKQWEEFAKELEAQFQKRFENFDALTDLSEITKGLSERFDSLGWPSVSAFEHFGLSEEALKEAQKAQEEALKKLQEFQDHESFKELQERMKEVQKNMQQSHPMRMDRKVDDQRFQQYEQALQEQLTEDGYLSETESIQSMEWTDESFKVNGKPIKEGDKKKYQELHDRWLGKGKYAGKVE